MAAEKTAYRILRGVFLVCFIIYVLFVLSIFFRKKWENYKLERAHEAFILISEKIVRSFSPQELLLQKITTFLPLNKPIAAKSLLYPFGGIFVHPAGMPSKTSDLKKVIGNLRDYYKKRHWIPPLFSIDQEGGPVQRLYPNGVRIPAAMDVSAAVKKSGLVSLYAQLAFRSCLELRHVGIQHNYAPVADIYSNPQNTVIGRRAFGTTPETVSRAVLETLRGMAQAGCLSTIKHFPGHGDTKTDSHYGLPIVRKNLEELRKRELIPFEKPLRKNIVPSVMVAHILYPLLDDHPASISKFWNQKILRVTYHFNGLIITDDLSMHALNSWRKDGLADLISKAWESGADIALIFDKPEVVWAAIPVLQKMLKAADFRNKVRKSARRIIYAKLKYCVVDSEYLSSVFRDSSLANRESLRRYKEYCVAQEQRVQDAAAKTPPLEALTKQVRALLE